MKLIYCQLFFSFLFYFSANTALSSDCLPYLGNGSICTAEDFKLTSMVINNPPADCTAGTIIPGGITLRVGIISTAHERYDIGFFIGNNDEPAIEGDSCTFSSLAPIETGGDFDPVSGHGPYRNLDGDSCGDADSEIENFKDIVLNDVLCQDTDNDGNLDIDYAMTWQKNKNYSCNDPSIPGNFYPPNSASCKAAIGNVNIPVIPPAPAPQITVDKSVSPEELTTAGGEVLYKLNITNVGTETVTITRLIDDRFGDVNGMGNCSVPQNIIPKDSYHCEGHKTLPGQSAGTTHENVIEVTAVNNDGLAVTDTDNAIVTFIPVGQTASIGDTVYNDLNGNAIHDDNEAGIFGVEIYLQLDSGSGYTTIKTTTTEIDGHYSFNSLTAGNYRVIPNTDDIPLNDWVHTGGIIPHDVTLVDDEHYVLADFGFSQASIEVNKSANPNITTAPSGLITYTIIVTNTGGIDVSFVDMVDTKFGDLSSKGCNLPQILTPDSSYTCQFIESVSGNHGDFHFNTVTVQVVDSEQHPHFASDSAVVEFRNPATSGSIGHLVWHDVNVNGIFDIGELVFDDVTLTLSGAGTASTTTHNGGEYIFSDLPAGDYTINVTDIHKILADYVLVTNNLPYNKSLAASEHDTKANFGYAKPQISITKTADQHLILPATDVLFKFVISNTGNIDLNVTSIIDSVFGNLNTICPPQLLTAGSSFTCNTTQNINPLGPYPVTHTNVVTVTANNIITNADITASDNENVTVVPPDGAIGYQIWDDLNNDGIKDSNESGIDGVTIDLTDNAGTVLKSTVTASGGLYEFLVLNGTYRVHVTDKAKILDGAALTTGADSIGINPSNDIIIDNSNHINLNTNFGYHYSTTKPAIEVIKTADKSTITGSQTESVNYTITVKNTGVLIVTLRNLYDTKFGDLNGKGDCVIGGTMAIGGTYSCSFTESLSGVNGDTHNNIVIAVAQTVSTHRKKSIQYAIAADKWSINFVVMAEKIPGLSSLGIFLLISLVLLFVYRKNKAVKIT